MMRQYDAQRISDGMLWELGLYRIGWRTIFSKSERYAGRCWHDRKRIELSLVIMQARSDEETKNTVIHEIAHAICGHTEGHGDIWKAKAKELGYSGEPTVCTSYVDIDKGRAVLPTEVKPKRTFHRVNKPCPICGKDAIEENSIFMNNVRWSRLKCGHLVKHEQIKVAEIDFHNWKNATGTKQLYPYQAEGIKFLEACGGRGLICDEPGLGKTAQAQVFTWAHKEECCPVLWVCKATLKLQAIKEAMDWCGIGFMGQIIDNPRTFILPNLKLYVISMDLLRNMPTEKLDKIGFKTVVADEIQHFKNPDSTRTGELRKLVAKAEYFIPLSGTPWKNRGQEYFAVLNMLDPVRFPSYDLFKRRWVRYYTDPKTYKVRQGGINDIPKFREFTKDIVIRRMRDDVLPDLPKIRREIRFIDMETQFGKAYDEAETRVANIIKTAIIDGKDAKSIQGDIMVLKHIAGLAKCEVAIEDAIEFLDNTEDAEKITIFHHHIDVGDNLQKGDGHSYDGLDKWLVENGYNKSLRLYGGRSPEERDDLLKAFRSDIKNRVLIASTLASGEGLNIQFCQNAMMVERQWNPANEEQAELRFSRPLTKSELPLYLQDHLFNDNGEQKKVSIRIPYLIAEGTVDSMLVDIIEKKRIEFNRSMNKGQEDLTFDDSDIMHELADMILKRAASRQKSYA